MRESDGICEKAHCTIERKKHRVFTVALENGPAIKTRLKTQLFIFRGLIHVEDLLWPVTCEDGDFFPFLHVYERIFRVILMTAAASFAQGSAYWLALYSYGVEVVRVYKLRE